MITQPETDRSLENSSGEIVLNHDCSLIITRNCFDKNLANEHFKTLHEELPWNNADKIGLNENSRSVLLYGYEPYSYTSVTHNPQKTWHPLVKSLLTMYNAMKGSSHNQVLVTKIENGDHFLPNHQDSEDTVDLKRGVGAVVFGASRVLQIAPYGSKSESNLPKTFMINNGDF